MRRIQILDTTLRDGAQAPGATITGDEKLRLAHQLDALGVDVIEAGFPAGSPTDEAVVRRIASDVRRPVIAALARSTPDDIDLAARALERAERPRLHVFVPTSEIYLRERLRISQEQCVERAVAAVERARRHTSDVQFSAQDATRTDVAFLCRVMQAAAQAGATTLNLLDSTGYARPADFQRMIESLYAMVEGIDGVVVSVHCHDDLGLAVANSLAAIEAGAGQVECTVNGIGPRAGNAALEEVVMALRVRADGYGVETGINVRELYRTSDLLSYLTGIHPQPNKAVVGKNAFARRLGLPEDLTNDDLITPEMVGAPEAQRQPIRYGDRDSLSERYREMGYELSLDEAERAYRLYQLLAEQKKTILDEDLISILHHGTMEDVPAVYKVQDLEVVCGKRRARARVRISEPGGAGREATGEGDGPIAAAFSAIDSLVDYRMELEDLTIVAATPGEDAVGEVTVRVRVDGKTFTGRGASPDVVYGAVRAYLHALDKAAHERELGARALEKASYLWGV